MMDSFLRLIQVAGAIALVVAVAVGYGTVRPASAQFWPWCDEVEECHEGTRGSVGPYACQTPDCDSRSQHCCLDDPGN